MVLKSVEINSPHLSGSLTTLKPGQILTAQRRLDLPQEVRQALDKTHLLIQREYLNIMTPDLESEVVDSQKEPETIITRRGRRNNIRVDENHTARLYKEHELVATIKVVGG